MSLLQIQRACALTIKRSDFDQREARRTAVDELLPQNA